jgi:hypothetical protein
MASLFGEYDDEADVREIIVRPLLHELGYRQGTQANIRTEVADLAAGAAAHQPLRAGWREFPAPAWRGRLRASVRERSRNAP